MSDASPHVEALARNVRDLMDQHKAALRELDLAADTIDRQKNDIKLLSRENLRLSLALEERGQRRIETA